MNKIKATILNIQNIDNLNIVEFDFNSIKLKMMSLELKEGITIGKKVILTVKPSHISLAKNLEGNLTISNKIDATIEEIIDGELLSLYKIATHDTILESIFTYSCSKEMSLKKGEEITLLIKASDLSILEILDD